MYRKFFKRVLDIVLSLFALIVLSPFLLLFTVLGAIAMKGNPFFVQERPGMIDKNTGKERIIKMIKFRSMTNAKDKDGNLLPGKQRLNKYGRVIRAISIDELPSLINIIVGDLSIIGPRPLTVKYLQYYTQEERRRHEVRPGLTGYAQITGKYNTSPKDKLIMDMMYIEQFSILRDIQLIFQTAIVLLKSDSTEAFGSGAENPYVFEEWKDN